MDEHTNREVDMAPASPGHYEDAGITTTPAAALSKPNGQRYEKILVMFMSFMDRKHYEDDAQFTTEQLSAITPLDIVHWMNLRTYGIQEPSKEQLLANNRFVLPPKVLSNTLRYWKKALSYYMPHKDKPWNLETHEGNPTRCHIINEMIQLVKRKEDLSKKVSLDPKVFHPVEDRPPTVVEAATLEHLKNGGIGIKKVSVRDQINGLQQQLYTMQETLKTLLARQEEDRKIATKQYTSLSAQIRLISASQQSSKSTSKTTSVGGLGLTDKRLKVSEAVRSGISPNATLIPNPRTLGLLWEEYIHGIGGRKPAKDFTSSERGRVRHKYHRRKVVWSLIANLVRAGHTAEDAIEMIYKAYGADQSVTVIINKLKRDIMEDKLHSSLKI